MALLIIAVQIILVEEVNAKGGKFLLSRKLCNETFKALFTLSCSTPTCAIITIT